MELVSAYLKNGCEPWTIRNPGSLKTRTKPFAIEFLNSDVGSSPNGKAKILNLFYLNLINQNRCIRVIVKNIFEIAWHDVVVIGRTYFHE